MLTVAICTHNRAERLRNVLTDLVRECRSVSVPVEVIVVANACRDHTLDVANSFLDAMPLRVIVEPRAGLSVARNCGVTNASRDVLVFLDDDVRLMPGWLQAYEIAFRDPTLLIGGGQIRPVWPDRVPRWTRKNGVPTFSTIVPHFDQGTEIRELTDPDNVPVTANLAVRMSALRQIGPFREDLGPHGEPGRYGGEDMDMIHRVMAISGTVRYLPDAIVEHPVYPERLKYWFNLTALYSGGIAQARLYPPAAGSRTVGGVPRFMLMKMARNAVRGLAALVTGRLSEAAGEGGSIAVTLGYIRGVTTPPPAPSSSAH